MSKAYRTLSYIFAFSCLLMVVASLCNSILYEEAIKPRIFIFLISSVLFIAFSFMKREISYYANAVIIYLHGIYSLWFSPTQEVFGILLLVLSTSLLFAVGLFQKHWLLKIVCVSIVCYISIIIGPISTYSNYLLKALEWTLFITGFCFIHRMLLSESIRNVCSFEVTKEKKYIEIIDEATSVAREAIDLLKMLKDESNGK